MPEAAPSSDVGTWFGKYFLMKKLAAGGMGEVFLARQQGPAGFQKVLVVKKILGHLTESKEFVEAFLGEARLAAQMNHRNIVQVFELGEHEGAYFIAMEYVQGKSLRDLIDATSRRKERVPAELCRSLAEQICDGASYAHNLTDLAGRSLNLVHRDLNPQNVLISYGGDVKIIDFGIAKSELSTVKTEAGMIKGKFVYMSPEQSLAKKLDKRSDIFAIGISLYEMLTGVNPFHKNNIVLTLEAVQRYEPPPPSEYDPGYAPFDPILSRALAKDRDRRYSDAAEMQDDLRRVVLPRPPERLGPFVSRLFRAQLEEEQQLLVDSDKRMVGSARRTPPRATPSKPSGASTVPDAPAAEDGGGTLLLPNAKAAKAAAAQKPATPPRPAATPRPPPPRAAAQADEAGDTLIDAGDGGSPPRAKAPPQDDAPGGTLMLNPGAAPPPPPSRKPAARARDAVPENTEEVTTPEAPGGTQVLVPGRQPEARPAKKAREQASTNIMTAEESEEAQRSAQAKLEQASRALVRTRTRADKRAEQRQARSSRGMWIALGVGTLAAVALIVGLLFLFFSDDSVSPVGRRARRLDGTETRATPADPGSQSGSSRR
ncbi:MAG TPA: protein kinase [Myxococcales bacterium]|nr:protein kinase [Myxococcales bacterium]